RGRTQDVQSARLLFAQARDRLAGQTGQDPELAPLREETSLLLAAAEQLLSQREAQAEAQRRYVRLFQLRDDAFFQLNRDVGAGAGGSSPRDSEAAARQALDLFGMSGDSPRSPNLTLLEPDQRERARVCLYEVLLVLADAVVRPAPAGPNGRRSLEMALQALD